MTRVFSGLAILLGSVLAAGAQVRSPATGDAIRMVRYGCDPCCYVTNLSAEKPVQATLHVMMARHEVRIEPGQTARFPLRNECMKGAMGLEVNFAR